MSKTIFCDIDGTLFKFEHDLPRLVHRGISEPTEGSADKLAEWHCKGYTIILVTGRPETMREDTVRDLRFYGMIYDQLIMGCGSGPRYLINDLPNENRTAKSYSEVYNMMRNHGIGKLEI